MKANKIVDGVKMSHWSYANKLLRPLLLICFYLQKVLMGRLNIVRVK